MAYPNRVFNIVPATPVNDNLSHTLEVCSMRTEYGPKLCKRTRLEITPSIVGSPGTVTFKLQFSNDGVTYYDASDPKALAYVVNANLAAVIPSIALCVPNEGETCRVVYQGAGCDGANYFDILNLNLVGIYE